MSVLWAQGEPIAVSCSAEGRPVSFVWQARTHEVERVCNRWRVSETWWREDDAAWKEYIKLVTRDGLLCLLSRDLEREAWEMIRLYD